MHSRDWLRIEEEEYRLADRLLCPSDFVVRTFLDRGFAAKQLARHQYGFDEKTFHPAAIGADRKPTFTMLFAGGCAPRKGLHYALEAWLRSPAHRKGFFQIAGEFVPGYAEHLNGALSHSSIKLLGFRRDVPELMRNSDVLVLPSVEEGSALVTHEAREAGACCWSRTRLARSASTVRMLCYTVPVTLPHCRNTLRDFTKIMRSSCVFAPPHLLLPVK